MTSTRVLLAAATSFAISFSVAGAVDSTWIGGTSGSWNNNANWQDSSIPISGNDIIFDSNSTENLTTTLDAVFTVNSIKISDAAGAVSIANGTEGSLTIGAGGIDMSTATQNLTIRNTFTLSEDQTWSVASGKLLLIDALTNNAAFDLGGKTVTIEATALSGSNPTDGNTGVGMKGVNVTNGSLVINSGVLRFAGDSGKAATLGAGSTYQINTGAVMALVANSGGVSINSGATISLNGGTLDFQGGAQISSTGYTITGSGTVSSGQNTGHTVGGNFTGNGNITLKGSAVSTSSQNLTLTGDNSGFTGTFTLDSTQTVTLGSSTAGSLGSWVVGLSSGNTISVLSLDAANIVLGAVTLRGSNLNLTANATGATATSIIGSSRGGTTIKLDAGAELTVGSTTMNWGSTVTANGTLNVTNQLYFGSAASLNGSGIINTSELQINNGTTLTQSNGTINAEKLTMRSTSAAGTNVYTLNGGRINIGAGGIVEGVAGNTKTLNFGAGTVGATADWSSSMAITLTDAAAGTTFNTTDAANNITARNITLSGNLTGTGGLVKMGSGTLTLAGTNTYTGNTVVNEGILNITGSIVSEITVAGGRVTGAGTTTVTLTSGAEFLFDLDQNAPAIDIGGLLDLNGANLKVVGTVLDNGNPINLATYGSYSGTFAGLSDGDTVTSEGGQSFTINYTGTGISLSLIPEPSTYALGAAGLLGALVLIRRRRK